MGQTLNRSLYPILIFVLALIAFLLMPRRVISADRQSTEFLVESSSTRAEVKLLYPENAVEVKLLDRDRLGLPDAVQISLFNDQGSRLDLELTAITSENLSGDLANQRKYMGQMPNTYESYVGISVRIPFTRSPATATLSQGRLK